MLKMWIDKKTEIKMIKGKIQRTEKQENKKKTNSEFTSRNILNKFLKIVKII